MFKNKGFLYGLGIGLILGASLLQLMNFAVLDEKTLKNDIQAASPSISPSISPTLEPVESVKPISTVEPIETTQIPEKPSTSAIPKPTITKTEEPVLPTPIKTKAEEIVLPTPIKANAEEPVLPTPKVTKAAVPAVPTPLVDITDPAGKIVLIEKGMSSAEVASLLFNEGIIKDQKAFDDSLAHLKLDRIIRVGSYSFLPNELDEDIINKITTIK